MHQASPRERRPNVPAPLMVLVSMISVQFGAAHARGLIQQTSAPMAVCIRSLIAGSLMLLALRPSLRGRTGRQWRTLAGFVLAVVFMNTLYYAAIARLPLGVTTTIEFMGPLGLAALTSRRPKDLVAVVLALAGVVAVSGIASSDISRLDPLGVVFAAVSGIGWASYIVATRRLGQQWEGLDGLALGIALAGVVLSPLAVAMTDLRLVGPDQLATGVLVAIVSSIIPYSISLLVLRRVEARVFGILMSLEPGVAAAIGFLVLGQALVPLELVGMVLVIAASAVVMTTSRQDPATELAETA